MGATVHMELQGHSLPVLQERKESKSSRVGDGNRSDGTNMRKL